MPPNANTSTSAGGNAFADQKQPTSSDTLNKSDSSAYMPGTRSVQTESGPGVPPSAPASSTHMPGNGTVRSMDTDDPDEM